jgi:NADPH:quinone reductase-like Zn-dependent oxidoreductase
MHERWPATFPSGQGSDLAGIVEEVGPGVDSLSPGDEVIGWTDQRASHAELVLVPVEHLIRRPAEVSWEAGGALFVAGTWRWPWRSWAWRPSGSTRSSTRRTSWPLAMEVTNT